MLLLIIQAGLLAAALYWYIFEFWAHSEKCYYDLLILIYGIVLGLAEFLVCIILFILVRTRVQITSMNVLYRYVKDNCYKEYYALIIINMKFLLAFCVISIVDNTALHFATAASVRFAFTFYIQTCLFVVFSTDLLRRRSLLPNEQFFETEGVFRCAYEVVYYVISLLIVISYFLVSDYNSMPPVESTLSQLLIYSMAYFLFSMTKVGILIKIFLFIVIIRLIYFEFSNISDYPGQITPMVVLSIIFLLRIIQQIVVGCYRARQQNNRISNQPVDVLGALNLLPQREPYNYHRNINQLDALTDEEIEQLEHHIFSQTTSHDHLCSICDMAMLKEEIVIKIGCNHIFHSECLKPWLKVKNSCPNCRRYILNRNAPQNPVQLELIQAR